MTIEYTWNISQLNCYPESNGQVDVAFTAHWTLGGTDGTYQGFAYGSSALPAPKGSAYIPYNELTLEQTIAWVKESLGEEQVASYEANIASQIEALIKPTVVSPPLPWNNI